MDEKEEFNLTLPIILIGILAIAVLLFFTLFDKNVGDLNLDSIKGVGSEQTATAHFIAPDRVSQGGIAMFSWKADVSEGATCEGTSEPEGSDGGWSGKKSLSGKQEVGPIDKNTSYFLDCVDGEDVSRDIELVAVIQPKVIFESNATSISSGGSVMLSWDAVSVHGCTLGSEGKEIISMKLGNYEVKNITETSTYTLECATDGEPIIESITINVE